MHFKITNEPPPGSMGLYRYTQPETVVGDKTVPAHSMSDMNFRKLVGKIVSYRMNNGIPVPELVGAEIEDAICRQLSPQNQMTYCETGFRRRTGVHWKELEAFIVAVKELIKRGLETVPQEEAERRARICADCPLNVSGVGCGVCRATLNAAARLLIPSARTSQDARLQACGHCGCELQLSVHLPLEVLREAKKNLPDFPDWCWQSKKSSEPSSTIVEALHD